MTKARCSRRPKWLIPGYDPEETAGDCHFDEAAAQHALDFFEHCCHHVKGELAGKRLKLQPWQRDIVRAIFGWKRPDGTRRYREVFIYVPRKNGKTTFCAAIALYMLCMDGEPGAEVYSAAAEKEQAAIVYDIAKGMVLIEPELRKRLKPFKTFKSIVHEASGSSYKALSADADTKHGFNAHCCVIDELHVHKNRDLVDVLETSTGSRRQPLMIIITTADFDRVSICNEKHDYATKVRDGIYKDPYFLPVIYEASKDEDWRDPKTWAKANPNLGVSVELEYLERECQRAIDSPANEFKFKRLHLNMKTSTDVRWIDMGAWDQCAEVKFEERDLAGEVCFGGLDLATTVDIAACVLVFPKKDEPGFWVVPRFWIPADNAVIRERRDKVPYLTWEKSGLLTLTPGTVIDYSIIRKDLNTLARLFHVVEIAFDPWNSAHIVQELTSDGFDMIEFGQNFGHMSPPCKELEKQVLGGTLSHGGNEVLRWMASNAYADLDGAGNMKPSKKKSREKIDGIVALAMALGRAIAHSPKGPSVYESRGFVSL